MRGRHSLGHGFDLLDISMRGNKGDATLYCLPGRVYHIFRDLLKRFSLDQARCKTDTIPVWGCTGCTFKMHTGVQ